MHFVTKARRDGARWPRRRAWRLAVLTVLIAGAATVPVAWANHQFGDVPTASPHHTDVSAIFGARITTGCSPSPLLYCPGDFVRRDQMASFLRRGLGRTDAAGTTDPIALTGTFQDIAVVSLATGGTTGGTGAAIATGDFTAFAPSGALTNGARVEFRLVQDGGTVSNFGMTTLYPGTGAHSTAAASKTWQFFVDTGATETFRLQARLASSAPGDATDVDARVRHLQVLYVPFFELVLPFGQGAPSTVTDGSDR